MIYDELINNKNVSRYFNSVFTECWRLYGYRFRSCGDL